MSTEKFVKLMENPRKGFVELGIFAIGMGIFFRGFYTFYCLHRYPLLPPFHLGWLPNVGCGLLFIAGIVTFFRKSLVVARVTAGLIILTFAIVPPIQWMSGDWELTIGMVLLLIVSPLTLFALGNIK